MRPTRPSVLVEIAVVAGVLAWVVARLFYERLPALPLSWAVSLAVLAVAEGGLAWSLRQRRSGRPGVRPVPALTMSRAAALARASSVVGALGTGVMAGFGIYTLPGLDKAAVAGDGRRALAGLVGSLLLVAAALALEAVCRLPRPPEEPPLGSAP